MMTPSSTPKVTIGLPTFNRRSYLAAALDSARAQTYSNLEIIVSDNASNDGTWDYLQSIDDPRLVLRRNATNIGGVANLNACLGTAAGELFLLLSDDDLLDPEAIEELSLPFREGEAGSVGVVWCPCTVIDANGKAMWDTEGGPAMESSVSLIEGLWLGHRGPRLASVLVRTSDAQLVGEYDETRFGLLCDTGNWGQVALRYDRAVCISKPLVRYRVHPSSATGGSVCAQWQRWGESLHAALVGVLVAKGDTAGAVRILRLRKQLLANLTVDVLMRGKGNPGWILRALREVWRSRRFMLTPYVFRRALVDGMKLVRSK